jgi:hypothetical protein
MNCYKFKDKFFRKLNFFKNTAFILYICILIEDIMLKKIIALSILFCLIVTLIGGCITQDLDDEKNNIFTKDISLSEIFLTENDFPQEFTMLYENHSTEPRIEENPTGHGLTWYIEERYDATYYNLNSTDGVMQSLLKLDAKDSAQELASLTREDLAKYKYNEEEIEPIGDTSFLFSTIINETNITYTYYTLAFSIDTIFIALGGSVAHQSTFIDYAKTIEKRIIDAALASEQEIT